MAFGARGTGSLTKRTVAWWLVVLGGLAFVLLASFLVPWQPVPGGAPDPVAAESVFTQAEIQRGEGYSHTVRLLSWGSLAVSLLVACVLGFTARGARLVGSRRWPWGLTVVALTAALLAIGRVATLPFALLIRHQRLENGLSNQSLGAWWVDQVKSLGVGIVITSLAMLVLIGCARRWRRWWPAVAAALSAALVVIGSFLYPLLVEPVFNNFEPMAQGPLRDQIFELAETEGVQIEDVLVADASRRTTTLNAYVSGFGDTRRVVVYDNLVETLPDDQALSVVAHELAHARHDDVLVGTGLGAAGAVFGVGLAALIVGSRGVRRRAGVGGMADPRVVALVLALTALGSLAAAPIENSISRRIETRADVDALQATNDPEAFADMQRRLALRSLADPTPPPFAHFWFGSHPTVLERVALTED